MALEKKVVIDKIEVLEDGQIQVRQATKVLEDGKEIGKTYYRWVISPGDDFSKQDKRVKDIAQVVHTQEVKDAYIAKQAGKIKRRG
jgi:hypothetical protein